MLLALLKKNGIEVSVPIRGLFNLTGEKWRSIMTWSLFVSVPIRGLFNLTHTVQVWIKILAILRFRPH